jgi:hypothetical protein
MNNHQAPQPNPVTIPPPGISPDFDRFAELGRKLFAVPKADLDARLSQEGAKLRVDGTPKQKPGRKPR